MLRISRLVASAYLVFALAAFGLSALIGPLGYAPFPLTFGTAAEPVVITLAYGTEKEAWLKEAAQRFATSGARVGRRTISVQLQPAGSRELALDIVEGRSTPTAISPASSVQVEQLVAAWAQRNGGEIINGDGAPVPLVLTPLVVVGWKQRTATLWPNGPGDLWRELQGAADKGWAAFGHPEWGDVKLGHTRPTTSNSGLQTLLLLAYSYHGKTSGLSVADVRDEGFRQWLLSIEQTARFGDSTGTLMTDMLRFGPSTYDMVAVYENLAVQSFQAASSRVGELQVFYPPATVLSDHPYAVLSAPWVTAEQRQAALLFRDFLRSAEMQRLALSYGFRPADPSVAINSGDTTNPFVRYRDAGLRIEIGQQVQSPPPDIADALIELWRANVGR